MSFFIHRRLSRTVVLVFPFSFEKNAPRGVFFGRRSLCVAGDSSRRNGGDDAEGAASSWADDGVVVGAIGRELVEGAEPLFASAAGVPSVESMLFDDALDVRLLLEK